MPDKNATESLWRKVKSLPLPWCEFSLDEARRYTISGQADYDAHGVVRDLIYSKHEEEASITMGKLPPIISPMFWETISGYSVEEVRSLKDPNTHVPIERYEGYKRMAGYWKKINKVFPIDLRAYRGSLIESYIKQNLSIQERIEDIDRRVRGLGLFRASLEKGDWPKLLLIVPDSPEVPPMDWSFTITPHMEVQLIRGEGRVQHRGWLYYSPKTDVSLLTAWNDKWILALDYVRSRKDWPKGLVNIDLIHLFQDQCQQFNLGSVYRLCAFLERFKASLSDHAETKPESKVFQAFLCHASEDKGAIVQRFHDLCTAKDIKTWYDKDEIAWGDRVFDKISQGLVNSRYVVIFVSKSALKKEYVREELFAALNLGMNKENLVLPVLLGITSDELKKQLPFLASRRYLSLPIYDANIPVESSDLETLVGELADLIQRDQNL